MSPRQQPRGLGRGISALMGDIVAKPSAAEPQGNRPVAIEKLHPGKYQPRHHFDDAALDALAASMREQGVLQPLLVRPHPTKPGEYEIVAGERRWRAAQKAQLHEVPVLVRELDDRRTLEIGLVENVQREDLNAVEEAEAYRRLMEEFNHTQEALATSLGKSRSHIANTLRLLALPAAVLKLVEAGSLTAGHARALVTAANPQALAQQIVAAGLSVRETERLAARGKAAPAPAARRRPAADADIRAVERDVSAALGLKVSVKPSGKGGALTISYGSLEQLEDVISRLTRG
jgi:ParB family chromosome partitioning protein